MSDAANDQSITGPRSRTPIRTWAIRAGIGVVVISLLFYGGGGWYFATQLGDDAFVVSHSADSDDDVEVVGIDSNTITLSVPADDEPMLAVSGVTGFEHEDGRLRLGDVVADLTDGTNDIVTRSYQVLTGTAPGLGAFGDLDSWLYPDDPTFLFPSAEIVSFESALGPMQAWYTPGTGSTWVVLAHGKGAMPRETLRMMSVIGSMPMLSITYRNDDGAPSDPSGYHRYGTTEWSDLEAAVDWALNHGANDVVLAGFSTGAAVDVAFMYQSALADRVTGLILDAPNIDFGRTVDYGASQRTLPVIGLGVPQSLTTVAKFISSFRFDVDWSELDYIDDIDRIDVPMLVFHGTADSTVPVDVSERLAEARPDLVTLHTFVEAEHVQSWNADPVRYEAAVRRFLGSLRLNT